MSKYPIFLELQGRKVVMIGGGSVAADKAEKLLAAGAKITIIAEQISTYVKQVCQNSDATLIQASYNKTHLSGALLVIAATDNLSLNKQIYSDCGSLNILCNIVDNPDLCDFFVPAIAQRGDLQIAISTNAKCPAYAAQIRKKLETIFTEEHAKFLDELELIRQQLIKTLPQIADRKAVLAQLVSDDSFEFYKKSGPAALHQKAQSLINQFKPKT